MTFNHVMGILHAIVTIGVIIKMCRNKMAYESIWVFTAGFYMAVDRFFK